MSWWNVRLNFIAVTATLVLVSAISWYLGAAVTRNVIIEKRKTEVLNWVAKQDDLEQLIKSKYGVVLSTNTGIPGSFRLLNQTPGRELSPQEVEAIRVELYQRKCPYGITLIDGLKSPPASP